MTREKEKKESPACACGRGDLYFESLNQPNNKQNETGEPAGDEQVSSKTSEVEFPEIKELKTKNEK